MSFASVSSRFRPVPACRVPARTARLAGLPSALFSTLVLGAAVLLPGALRAQLPGAFDPSFLSSVSQVTVFSVAADYDGLTENILVGGDEAAIAVLSSNGITSGTFTEPPFGGGNRTVYVIAPEPFQLPGSTLPTYLLGGLFGKNLFTANGNGPAQNITRIDSQGAIDPNFQPGIGANAYVTSILARDDGSIVVGGLFTTFDKRAYPHVVVLNIDGSISASFQPVNVNDGVFAMDEQRDPATGLPNGQIIIGGTFQSIGGSNYTKLARIDLAGNVDSSFRPVIDSRVLAIAAQPDGKILIGGEFSIVNGVTVGHIARLNQDGSLDTSFVGSVGVLPPGTSAPVAVYVLKLLSDGRIYVGGQLTAVDGVYRQYLGRMQPDGSLDASFDPGNIITNSVQSLSLQKDNGILVAETVSKKVDGVFPPSLIRLFGDPVTVTATATKSVAREGTATGRKNGVFTFTRTHGDTSGPQTVYFRVDGTAKSGTAYKSLSANLYDGDIYRATFAAGQKSLKLKIKPLNNQLSDAPETVVLTMLPSQDPAPYGIGGLATSTVQILNAP